jgi:hypothetical protein
VVAVESAKVSEVTTSVVVVVGSDRSSEVVHPATTNAQPQRSAVAGVTISLRPVIDPPSFAHACRCVFTVAHSPGNQPSPSRPRETLAKGIAIGFGVTEFFDMEIAYPVLFQ